MAYKALVLNLLISAPGDIPPESLTTIRKAISQWNCNYGQQFSLNVLPISWTEHAVAEFGDRPQALLNKQIVDDADLAIALFRDRLGTPTGEAESGTAEEIKVLAEAGKQIAILVDSSPRNPLTGPALKERQRLEDYLSKLYDQALILKYADNSGLIGHINNFLSRSASQFQQNAEQAKKETPHENGFDSSEGVWPSAEVHERAVSDSQGRIKTKRKWELVLNNTSHGPAKNVNFVFEGLSPNALFEVIRKKGPIGTIPPEHEIRFPLMITSGSPSMVECIVTWTDAKGNQRTTQSTIHI
ncbi:hypothetical protein [Corynebacterium matruchotii]|uniref:hypothetical protein n=1 Tax=Corynebacterium matruchotii TaxID=43768 RepID=UPI0028E94F5F|nr:hypothetical protein [Corynebacterium matruchotii]